MLSGTPPEGIDLAVVEDLLAQRIEAKKARDFDGADELRGQLRTLGVYVDDRTRTWEAAKQASGGYKLQGSPPAGIDLPAVEALLTKRREAKKAREFGKADEMQQELLAMGVWIDDRERTWSALKSEPKGYTLKGDPPPGVEAAAVDELLMKRLEAKKVREYETADALRAQLLEMGVYIDDKKRMWEAAKWTKVQAAADAKAATDAAVEVADAPAAVASWYDAGLRL